MTNIYWQDDHPFSKLRGAETFSDSIDRLKSSRAQLSSNSKPSVAILGAGPAGLLRAIQSIALGNPTFVVERRSENAEGRYNVVALDSTSIDRLKKFGIYQYLKEHQLIFPPAKNDTYSIYGSKNEAVRLVDLENAMKAVIKSMTDEQIIFYDRQVTEIKPDEQHSRLALTSKEGNVEISSPVNVIVNTEGSHSSTNTLLKNYRIEVLPKIPVIATIFRESIPDTPESYTDYAWNQAVNTATFTYYYASYLFKSIFEGERFWNPAGNVIAGAVLLETPGQNYLGTALSKNESENLKRLNDDVANRKEALKIYEAKKPEGKKVGKLKEELKSAEIELESYVRYWTGLSFCAAKCNDLAHSISNEWPVQSTPWLPLKSFHVIEIGADRAEHSSLKLNENTAFLVSGDALATVDPSTGLGCNQAIITADSFIEFVKGMDEKVDLSKLLEQYDKDAQESVDEIHKKSKENRMHYRPNEA